MIGIVRGVNRKRGLAAVETDLGFTVFEILGSAELSVGDEIVGDLDSHGGETLRNRTTGETFSAYVEAIQATRISAETLLRSS